jgi:hypothetical protein
MDIRKRINARKVVLAYIYEHCFFSAMQKNLIIQPSKVAEA